MQSRMNAIEETGEGQERRATTDNAKDGMQQRLTRLEEAKEFERGGKKKPSRYAGTCMLLFFGFYCNWRTFTIEHSWKSKGYFIRPQKHLQTVRILQVWSFGKSTFDGFLYVSMLLLHFV